MAGVQSDKSCCSSCKKVVGNNDSALMCLRICAADNKHVAGKGTYERQGYIYSTLAGILHLVKQKEEGFVIEVHSSNEQSVVPVPGNIVTAKVMTINLRMAICQIRCIGDTVLSQPYRGILRREDIRATEKDKVEVYNSVRPGDIILARVLPVNEVQSYQLSTAENELGVVIAHTSAGVPMIPISWDQMQCPKTYVKENRKVAKIVPEDIVVD
ncbi:exosome complex component CSL4 isoform X2 [Nilaparvata lugens]|uniref:exosome complex component CSL4 isoform X2 n=1 Tax=Nilaparvata lugens TaxID=108931 RepID=UPI00193E7010|nr:exosome complex component CSL4 isoform X2 [Nilaparvata lugens]